MGGFSGHGGGGGGGSFGILIFQGEVVVVRDNTIVTATGGAGRGGLSGGPGATNNHSGNMDGEPGGTGTLGSFAGGSGGDGGPGGRGGDGGGGGGGPSIGIAYFAPPTMSGNVFTIGAAGFGGSSPASPGADGQSYETKAFIPPIP